MKRARISPFIGRREMREIRSYMRFRLMRERERERERERGGGGGGVSG